MMRTKLTDAEFRALLMSMGEFHLTTHRRLPERERTLILRGRLTPVTVGRRTYYLRRDVETLIGGAS
jgi:hypothetical protein